MKRDQQNPGGEEHSNRTMKGCEKYMARGQGDMTRKGYEGTPPPMKNQALASPSKIAGMAAKGHVRTYGHSLTSTTGATVTGKQVGAK